MKVKYDRTLEEQINDRRKQEKANVVFLKLFPKHKNTKSWVSIKSQTFPSIGLGFLASKSSGKSRIIRTSLVNHTNFGIGLFIWIVSFHRFFM